MKAELIANIIAAHCSGDESKFKTAVDELAADEDKKGNVRVSSLILAAYKGDRTAAQKMPDVSMLQESGFTTQSAGGGTSYAPRDKDSHLELYDIVEPSISLDDVILPAKQKQLLLQILDEQKENAKLAAHNLPAANRLLLCGPPGCGKTMTANAIANELGLPMAYVRLDGLVSSYLGQTSVNLRKVFSSMENKPMVLFLDEFDAIAKKRDDGNELGELKRVVTALLQNFDNMPDNVFLIAATNHEHLLDPAIWRRFNYVINLGYPDDEQRAVLIEKWLSEYNIEHKLDIKKMTSLTADRSTAQLKELIMATAKRYVTTGNVVTMDDFVEILIQQLTNNANGAGVVEAAAALKLKGVSIRSLAKAIGMPHNTLSYQINKLNKEDGSVNG
ncbi:ATP-binding protein [Oscillospiraceae bacterium HV4-5-C5C]|nr:ATP-binding protein [Oscillospiraceae bacterium HV4-5-C5C]